MALVEGNWTIEDENGVLIFKKNGVEKMRVCGEDLSNEQATSGLYLSAETNELGTKAIFLEKTGNGGYAFAINVPDGRSSGEGANLMTLSNGGLNYVGSLRMDLRPGGDKQRGVWSRQYKDNQQPICLERVGLIRWWFTVLSNGDLVLYRGITWENRKEKGRWRL